MLAPFGLPYIEEQLDRMNASMSRRSVLSGVEKGMPGDDFLDLLTQQGIEKVLNEQSLARLCDLGLIVIQILFEFQ